MAERFEQRWRVVDKRVNARELLEERDTHADSGAFPQFPGEEVHPGENFELGAGRTRVLLGQDGSLEVDLGDDLLILQLNSFIAARETSQFTQARHAVILAVDQSKPPGRVREEVNARTKYRCGHHLQTKGESETGFRGHVSGAVSDVKRNDDSQGDGDGFQDEERASHVRWRDFGDIERCALKLTH